MRTIRIRTRNSFFFIEELDNGERNVVGIQATDPRHVHTHILNHPRLYNTELAVGNMLEGDNWHSSSIEAIEDIPSVSVRTVQQIDRSELVAQ